MKKRIDGLNALSATPAFWVLLGFATVALTVWLAEIPVSAEALYHTSRKIPAHSRQAMSERSPSPEQRRAQPQSPAPESEQAAVPVPAVSADDVDVEAAEKPVSYDVTPVIQAPIASPPATVRHEEPRLPKGAHPVVKAPMPLLPEQSTQPKSLERPKPEPKSEEPQSAQNPQKVATAKPAKVKQPKTRQPKIAKAKSQQGNVTKTVPAETLVVAKAVQPAESDAKAPVAKSHRTKKQHSAPVPAESQPKQVATRHEHSKNKPTVRFPQELTAQSTSIHGRGASQVANAQNRHIYPVGYRPFIMPVGAEKHLALEKAISYYNRANFYGQQNESDNAIQEYQKALSLNPAFADAYVGLSTAAMRKNDWENVIEMARTALKMKADFMEPTNITQAKFNLSTAYCVTDNPRSAKSYYKKVKKEGHPDTERLWAYLQKNCKP